MKTQYSISDIIRYSCEGISDKEKNRAIKLADISPNQKTASILLYNLCKRLADMINADDFSCIKDEWNIAMNAHEAIKKATE